MPRRTGESSMSEAKQLLGATFLLMVTAFAGKICGFLREVFIASSFGTSMQADAFVAVATIPNLLLTMAGGAMSAALIPMVIRLRRDGEELRLRRLLSSMFSGTALVTAGLAILLFCFAAPFVDLYVFGFSAEAKALTALMTRIIVPGLVAITLISLLASVLNAHQHFLVPSLGPILYSLGVIVATVFFARAYGVQSLIIGMAAGIAVQFVLILATAFRKGVVFSFPRFWWNEDLRQAGRLMFPILIGVGVFELNMIVDRMMASTLPEGSLAALNYAYRVTQLPISLFVGTMVVPLFPMIAAKIAGRDLAGAKEMLVRSYHLLGILLLPVIALLVVLPHPIVAVLFQRGAFDGEAVQLTGLALTVYALIILPFALRDVVTRAMYAMQDTWTPVINSMLLVSLNVALMVIFVPRLGLVAIPGSTAIASIFAYVRLRYILIKRIGPMEGPHNRRVWFQILRNTAIFTAVVWGGYRGLLSVWPAPTGTALWLRTLLSIGAGGLVYVYLTARIDTPEVAWLRDTLRQKIQRIRGTGEGHTQ